LLPPSRLAPTYPFVFRRSGEKSRLLVKTKSAALLPQTTTLPHHSPPSTRTRNWTAGYQDIVLTSRSKSIRLHVLSEPHLGDIDAALSSRGNPPIPFNGHQTRRGLFPWLFGILTQLVRKCPNHLPLGPHQHHKHVVASLQPSGILAPSGGPYSPQPQSVRHSLCADSYREEGRIEFE
jgi:hypothetical protein